MIEIELQNPRKNRARLTIGKNTAMQLLDIAVNLIQPPINISGGIVPRALKETGHSKVTLMIEGRGDLPPNGLLVGVPAMGSSWCLRFTSEEGDSPAKLYDLAQEIIANQPVLTLENDALLTKVSEDNFPVQWVILDVLNDLTAQEYLLQSDRLYKAWINDDPRPQTPSLPLEMFVSNYLWAGKARATNGQYLTGFFLKPKKDTVLQIFKNESGDWNYAEKN